MDSRSINYMIAEVNNVIRQHLLEMLDRTVPITPTPSQTPTTNSDTTAAVASTVSDSFSLSEKLGMTHEITHLTDLVAELSRINQQLQDDSDAKNSEIQRLEKLNKELAEEVVHMSRMNDELRAENLELGVRIEMSSTTDTMLQPTQTETQTKPQEDAEGVKMIVEAPAPVKVVHFAEPPHKDEEEEEEE